MKFGELKIECIRIIDEEADEMSLENLTEFEQDEQYADLFRRMPGAINRALTRVASRKKLPIKTIELTECEKYGSFLHFDLKKVPDFKSVSEVFLIHESGYVVHDLTYEKSGSMLLLASPMGNCKLMLAYYPKAPTFSVSTDNNLEIDLPDEIVYNLPYFVYSEIYEREQPELSASARNKFELALDELDINEPSEIKIVNDYRIE